MPIPQNRTDLAQALATGRALRFSPNAAGDFADSYTGVAGAGWLSGIGDLDGDGRGDFIFGAPGDDDKAVDAGRVFVTLDAYAAGSSNGVADGLNRIIIDGVAAGDRAGAAVGSVADLNGDGLAEILVGAPGMDVGVKSDAGAAFVVWGLGAGGGIDLANPLAGDGDGYAILGQAAGDAAGTTIMAIGDLNGDGKADILVGAPGNDAGGADAGAAYVVWGKSTDTPVNLASVATGTGGFRITGAAAGDAVGQVIGTVADMNGDGKAEILIGTPGSDGGAGAAYVVFGKASGTSVNLASVAAGVGGFRITGMAGDAAGTAVTGLGDINGDGRGDLLIGAPGSASAYVVFGKAGTAAVDLADVALGSGGFQILAEGWGDLDALSVTGGVDYNHDGIADLIIGAPGNSEGGFEAGAVYVVWGGGSGVVDLALVAQGIGGAKIVGAAGSLTGTSVAIIGDANGDGTADLMIGAPGSGEAAYVLFTPDSWQPDDNIYGSNFDDVIDTGFGGRTRVGDTADIILGLGGNDSINGRGGDDSIEGGDGDDTLSGDAGNDTLDGGSGDDVLAGGSGDDVYLVDSALDSVIEQAGDGLDLVVASVDYTLGGTEIEHLTLAGFAVAGTGNAGANIITGNDFDNLLDGAGGADTLIGGLGNDEYRVDDAGDVVTEAAGQGSDTITSSINLTLAANVEHLVLTGLARSGTGNALANRITGTAGDDTLDGGAGADTLAGGLGDDLYKVDTAGDVVSEAVGEGTDTVMASIDYTLGGTAIENLVLTGLARSGTGNALANRITGTAGNDTLDGGAGADTLAGGLGDDLYKVDTAGDVVSEAVGEGTDTVMASIDYTLGGTAIENLVLIGSARAGTGNDGNNSITGTAGNDTLDGAGGIDTLIGGAGDDVYVVDSTTDAITELAGGGTDTVRTAVDFTLGANIENLVLTGSAHAGTGNALANSLTGGSGNDTLDGGLGNDTLDGGAGADLMIGGDGDDVYLIENAGDVVVEGATGGFDTVIVSSDWVLADNIEAVKLMGSGHTLTGNAANNKLEGDTGDDWLDGGDGDDIQIGGDGNDHLVAGSGHDTLAGGAGDDVYVLKGGGAHIEDFQGHDSVDASAASGDSHIDLSGETLTEVEGHSIDFGTGGTVTGALNVQFLQDLTGSFADDIATVRSLVPQIVAALQTVQGGAAFGVSSFRDKPIGSFGSTGDWVYRTDLAIGTGTTALTAAYSAMVASGGNDAPESQIEALMQLGLRAGSEVGFQANAARFVVLFTDAAYHSAGDGAAAGILTPNNGDAILNGGGIGEDYPVIGLVKAALEAANIIPIFAVTAGLETTYQGLATSLGRGTVVTLTANSSNVVTAITSGLATATTTHIADATAGAGNDRLIGNVGANRLDGGAGNDTLTGGLGDDQLLGGSGSDTALYTGARADYEVTLINATTISVRDLRAGGEGTDTLTDIEYLGFSDGIIAVAAPPANQAPTGLTLAGGSVAENAAPGTLVGTVTGLDPDAGDTLRYSLADDAGGRFAIDAATGAIRVAGGAAIDFETATSHGIAVTITDAAGASLTTNVSISVTNVADLAPVFASPASLALAENGTAAGTIAASDPDGLGSIAYSISGGADAALFAIDASTGALSFLAAPNFELPLDADGNNVYDVRVTASDGSQSSEQALAVTVSNILEAPTQSYTGTSLADLFSVPDLNGWTLSGAAGNDSLIGGSGADVLIGGRGNDSLVGGDGDDVVRFAAGDGVDAIDGGAGYDVLVATTANAVIGLSAIAGIERIDAGGFANVSILGTSAAELFDFKSTFMAGITQIDAGSGNDTIIGSAGADRIVLGSGNDVFHAGGGDDVFIAKAGAGADVIDGGAGIDLIIAGAATVAINVAAISGIEVIDAGGYAGVSLIGSSLADTLDFSAITLTGISVIDAGAGNDTVIGSAADDVILLGSGNDMLSGGDGNDVFLLKAGAGIDAVNGGAGHDRIQAAAANLSLTLSAMTGIEEISAGGFAGLKIMGTSGNDVMDFSAILLDGIASIQGGSGNDSITGSASADTIIGGRGTDIMAGGAGADVFVFQTAADSAVGISKADRILDFQSGIDRIDLSAIDADTTLFGDQAFTFIGDAAFTAAGQLRTGLDANGNLALFGNTGGSLAADFQISLTGLPPLLPTDIIF